VSAVHSYQSVRLRCGHSPGPGDRKKRLARLLGKWRIGDALSVGLEGIVSKRLSAPYRSGPSRDWIKVKNPHSPAMIRAREAEW
jgi:hypothetical protein